VEALEGRVVPAGAHLTWTGRGGDGLWSNPNNWNTNAIPSNGDSVRFPLSTQATVSQDDIANLSLGRLAIHRGNTVQVLPQSSLTLTGKGVVDDGAELDVGLPGNANGPQGSNLNGLPDPTQGGVAGPPAGTLDVSGQLTVKHGGKLKDYGTVTVEHNGSLTDAGSVTVAKASSPNGGAGGALDDHGQIRVESSGDLSVDGALTVEQDGSLTDSGSVTVGNKGGLDDKGTVLVAQGGKLDNAGSVGVEQGARLTDLGNLTVEHDASLTDAGNVTVAKSAASTGEGNLDDHGQITVASGGNLLAEEGALTVEHDGGLTDAGSVTVAKGGSLDNFGSVTVQASGTLTDHATLSLEAGSTTTDLGKLVIAGTAQQPAFLVANLGGPAPLISLEGRGELDLDTSGTGASVLELTGLPTSGPFSFTLVANSTGQVNGVFDLLGGTPLPEGAVFPVDGVFLEISYQGGSGHDVTFTFVGQPQLP
jgi:hypothetical protein